MAVQRVRDSVLELVQKVDGSSQVSSVFPVPGGSFFRLKTSSAASADEIVRSVKTAWPLCSASKSTSDLDGDVTVGVVVPTRRAAWTGALAQSRGGLLVALCGLVTKCVFMSTVLVFGWMVVEKLR